MYGTVVSVEDQDVVLELAPGVEVRFLRRAIMDVVPDPSEMQVEDPAPERFRDSRRSRGRRRHRRLTAAAIRVNGGPNDKRIERIEGQARSGSP